MRQLTLNGHALYCVVRAAQMLHQPHPNLPRIQSVLISAEHLDHVENASKQSFCQR